MNRPAFLMCPPDYYEVAYEINPWMSVRRRVHQKKAALQWKNFFDLLTRELHARVELLKPVRGLPDLVFTANAGVVEKRLFVRSNFRHSERRGEEPYDEAWFRKNGYRVKTVERPFCFEGEGDILRMGDELYTGFHFRSDVEAHEAIACYLRTSYLPLRLQDKRFYHLDTCFAPLDKESALVYMPAFEPYAQLALWETIRDPIEVPEDEALRFVCNLVAVGKNVILPEGCPNTAKQLEKRGFRVYFLDFSEFIKAGGAAKCLVLRLS